MFRNLRVQQIASIGRHGQTQAAERCGCLREAHDCSDLPGRKIVEVHEPSLDVFIERGIAGSVKLNLSLVSIQGSAQLRKRSFYDGDRNGSLLQVEDSRWHPGRWVMLTLSGTM